MSQRSEGGNEAYVAPEYESRYQAILDTAVDAIVIIDEVGLISALNPAAVRLFGYRASELIGKNVRVLMPQAHHSSHDGYLARNRRTGERKVIGAEREIEGRRKDGSTFPLEISVAQWRVDGERYFTGIIRDITARRALEEQLRLRQADAEAATLAKSEFLANMSHEIRTPLTAIVGFAALLAQMEDLPPQAGKFASRITTASKALLCVVNDILDFAKLDAAQVVLDPHPFSPKEFVAETLELVAGQAGGKGLDLGFEICGALPDAVNADSVRARQILLNLLSNAIKFTSQGKVTVGVSYHAEGDGTLRLAVSDTGIGIPPARLGQLFQRFSQVDGSTTRLYGGTGLGLAISKGLAEAMGGAIGVESRDGAGSTFWFTIEAPATELTRPAVAQQEPDGELGGSRILVVDDVAVNRELVGAMLAPFGFEITEAASGTEAVRTAMLAGFDLILMDLQMPGMDGMAATRAIRATCEINRTTPIIAFSANVLPVHLDACRVAGMNDHIAKPIDPRELLTKVGAWTALAADAEEIGGIDQSPKPISVLTS